MPDVLDVAKKPKAVPPPAGEPVSPKATTSWKCFQRVAMTLRKIGAHLNKNQEEVLELFEADFENYLEVLQAQDIADRKRRAE